MFKPNSSRGDYNGNRDSGSSRGGSGGYSYNSHSGGSSHRGGGGGGSFRDSSNRGGRDSYNSGPRRPNNQHEDINLNKPVWNQSTMKQFDKEFYQESSNVRNRNPTVLNDFLRVNNVSVAGSTFVKPILEFDDCDLPDSILNKFKDNKYQKPTPIQSMCWPTLMSGNDLVGIAQTGSGKTLGFVIPILVHITNNKRYLREINANRDDPPGPIALVLAPTRELAIQIQAVAEEYEKYSGIKNVCIYGGASKGPQAQLVRKGADIYIATPGRLLDFIKENTISLHRCTYLVLDEADRMLDMGFEPQIRKIVSQIRPDRQTVMFSATWPKEIQRMARDFCREDPIKLTIGSEELTANADITQQVEVVGEYEKRDKFMSWIRGVAAGGEKVLVFAETKRGADALTRELQYQQISAAAIHGDKDQRTRDKTLADFKSGRCLVLIATDVAQRGLDIKDVMYVVNYDVPKTMEDYIHRIGRTGRAGAKGTAVTFFPAEAYTPDLIRMARNICKSMKEVGQTPPHALLDLTGGRR